MTDLHDIIETTFWRNEGDQKGRYPFRATTADGERAQKVILSADQRIEVGKPVRVRVTRVTRPQSSDRGFIEAEFVELVEFRIDPDIYVDRSIARKLRVLLEAGYSILLDGPQGSGKTVLSRSIAEALEMEYVYFNSASVYEATDFVATLQVRSTGDGGMETVFIETDIARALRDAAEQPERHYLIFLDEFNRCRPQARNGLMPALDSTRKIFNPTTNSLIPIPDNVQFCAAINNGPQFVGTTAVDPAQMDRFATLKIDYPPPDEEKKILRRRFPSLDASVLDRVVNAAHAVRTSEELRADLSMRATEEACVFLSHPAFADELPQQEALEQALSTAFCGRFPGRVGDGVSDAHLVWEVIKETLE